MNEEQVKLLEEAFIMEGIFYDPNMVRDLDLAYNDATSEIIATIQEKFDELECTMKKVRNS